jgi:Gluconate 2-dehydrogenase subunit 3
MHRRHLIKGMGVIALYGSFPAILGEFISSCNTKDNSLRAGFFTDDEFHLIEQVSDIILPKTSSPGALEARVPYFIDLVVKNCLNLADQKMISTGLLQLNKNPMGGFSNLTPEKKLIEIKTIDEAAYKDVPDKAWFRLFKKLAMIGYFTSQDGMTKALDYVKVPGDYKACIPYKEGEKSMAKTFLMYW